MTEHLEQIDSSSDAQHITRPRRRTLTQACVDALAHAIESGTYQPGARLPSEAKLAVQLAVSRPTLRESLRLLEERGMIRRHQGRGTFVQERPITKDLNRNSGITSMIEAAGYEPSSRAVDTTSVAADAEVAERLAIAIGEPAWRIERVRLASGRAVAFAVDTFQAQSLPRNKLDSIVSGAEQSLYTLLQRVSGIVVHRGSAELEPCKATVELRNLLGVRLGAPLLCIRQVDFDQHDKPVVYSIEYHVADWVSFTVERLGPGFAGDEA